MRYRLLAGVAAICYAPLGVTPAVAQDAAVMAQSQSGTQEASAAEQAPESDAGEIIVTATRREQALQDVPLAVTAVSAEALRTRNIAGLADFANGSVPGMQIVQFAGTPSILAINARGIGLSDPTQGTQELAVPLYVDGVPLGRAQGLGLELIDPERVEFLRGPQGQLFGRNAEGGAVQYVSRRPTGKLSADASLQLGNYGLDRERLRLDLPEFGGVRLQGSVLHAQHNGYTKNAPKGVYSSQADYALLDAFGFRVAAEWSPIAALRINYSYDDASIKDSQPYGVWVPVDIVGRTPFSPMPAGDEEYPDRVNSPTFNETFRTKSNGHALTVQYVASDAIALKSITSYREASRHGSTTLGDALVAGGSSTGILRSNAREDVDQSQWYQEFQAIGSWEGFDLTVGATYFDEDVVDERRSRITGQGLTPPALGLSPPSLGGCIGLEICLTSHSEQASETKSYGVYAQGSWTPPILDQRLELTAGVRYSDDKKVAVRTYIQPLALPPFTEATPSGPLPPPAIFREKRWDPAFTVKYNFTDDINAYARYATAYRAGGANVRSSVFSSYGAEEVQSYELGFKSRLLDRRLTLNAAYYHNKIKGYQYNVQEAPTTNPSLTNTVNGANRVSINGIEIEGVFRAAKGLSLSFGYSYMDVSDFVEFNNPLTAAVDVTRFYSIQSPEHAGNVAVDYETSDLGWGSLALHADYAVSSGFWTTPGGLLVASLGPSYERPQSKTNQLNARVALRDVQFGPVKTEISIFGKNLLDDTNYTYGFDGAASGGGFLEYPADPLTFGIELRVRL
jgi:iron complex outermembrane recepter protein